MISTTYFGTTLPHQALPSINDLVVDRKVVLLRVDLNVPIVQEKVIDDSRIISLIPTIKELCYRESKVILASHYGRPRAQNPECPFLPIVLRRLETILDLPIQYIKMPFNAIEEITGIISQMPWGSIALLPNLRLDPGETGNDARLAFQLAALANIYVNEAFSCSHRNHTSIVGIPKVIPSAAGPSFIDEISKLSKVPVHKDTLVVIGGSKVATKINALKELVTKVKYIFVGGAMANSFLHHAGHNVGRSKFEDYCQEILSEILLLAKKHNCTILLPKDAVVCKKIESNTATTQKLISELDEDDIIADIGKHSIDMIDDILKQVEVVICNGPLGVYEINPFEKGSVSLLSRIADLTKEGKIISCAGGGDMNACLSMANKKHDFTVVSNAGGAFLEFIMYRDLPGIEALRQNHLQYANNN